MKALRSFETWGAICPLTQLHIEAGLNIQQYFVRISYLTQYLAVFKPPMP